MFWREKSQKCQWRAHWVSFFIEFFYYFYNINYIVLIFRYVASCGSGIEDQCAGIQEHVKTAGSCVTDPRHAQE